MNSAFIATISNQAFQPFESSRFIMCFRAPPIDAFARTESCQRANQPFQPFDSCRLSCA